MPGRPVVLKNLVESNMRQLPEYEALLVVLKESIETVKYSGTQESECYSSAPGETRDEADQLVSSARRLRRSILKDVYGSVDLTTDLQGDAAGLLATEKKQAGNCGEIGLDAYFRCLQRGLQVRLLNIGNRSENHVVLKFSSRNGSDYIFDPQHGRVYLASALNEHLKLWNESRQAFIDFDPSRHRTQLIEKAYTLEDIEACKLEIRVALGEEVSAASEPLRTAGNTRHSTLFERHQPNTAAPESSTSEKNSTCLVL
ncbi:hypothetical protein [Piscirickettsia litoralis]|uniref:Transglutaminase-like domain-containing protein n=1 Tax=Piscirickettsia litoralis TaxID=1891921 RepID=A0ABX3A5J5_9GAMM|nr:hypothetical protein [Piscirickettsia litoralis]ODN43698.1 hypothetical protein BGC07_13295 [Piscirickettsia litoralis]